MKLDNLTPEGMGAIANLYRIIMHGRDLVPMEELDGFFSPDVELDNVKKGVREGMNNSYDWRLGSKWIGHTKLQLDVGVDREISVGVNTNFDPEEREGRKYRQAESRAALFRQQVQGLLEKLEGTEPAELREIMERPQDFVKFLLQ